MPHPLDPAVPAGYSIGVRERTMKQVVKDVISIALLAVLFPSVIIGAGIIMNGQYESEAATVQLREVYHGNR